MTANKINTLETSSQAHEAANMIVETAKSGYVVAVLTILGIFAFITAVLVAWPAVSYFAAKLF